jgi:hypothetical protein
LVWGAGHSGGEGDQNPFASGACPKVGKEAAQTWLIEQRELQTLAESLAEKTVAETSKKTGHVFPSIAIISQSAIKA